MTQIMSNKIIKFEFLMSVLVILVHSLSNVDILVDFINKYVQGISVTPFFIISGYFMMKNTYTMEDVMYKVRKKYSTLFIPYILWNLIYYVFHLISRPGSAINLIEIVDAGLSNKYNPAFWFIYQLIMLTIISPLLFYTFKSWRTSMIMSAALIMVVLLGIDLPFFNEDALIYFYFGAIIAKYFDIAFTSIKNINAVFASLILSMGLFFINIACIKLSIYHIYIYNAAILSIILMRVSIVAFIYFLIDYIIKYDKVPDYMRHNFFLYATHYIIVRFIAYIINHTRFYISFYNIDASLFKTVFSIVIYLFTPFLCVWLSNKLYALLEKKAPKALFYLTGGR